MNDYYMNSTSDGTNVRFINWRWGLMNALLRFCWFWMPHRTAGFVRNRFMATRSPALTEEEAACLDRGRSFEVRVHHRRIRAWKWGSGPGILLVHGWNGRGAQFHRFVEPVVRAGYAAIAMDGPGHGQSDGRTTSYFEFSDMVRAFLSPELGLNIRGIVGHSFGAAAVINGLEKEGLGLKAVCIAPVLRLRELLLRTFRRFGVPAAIYDRIIGDFEARFGYSLAADDPHKLIGRLTAPVLIIHDEDDRAAAFDDSAHCARVLDHVRLFATRGLGHLRILGDDAVIAAALAYFGPAGSALAPVREERAAMAPRPAVVEQYAAADEERRLGLYLIHRSMREAFLRVELDRY